MSPTGTRDQSSKLKQPSGLYIHNVSGMGWLASPLTATEKLAARAPPMIAQNRPVDRRRIVTLGGILPVEHHLCLRLQFIGGWISCGPRRHLKPTVYMSELIREATKHWKTKAEHVFGLPALPSLVQLEHQSRDQSVGITSGRRSPEVDVRPTNGPVEQDNGSFLEFRSRYEAYI